VALHYFRGEERAAALVKELQSSGVKAMTAQADVTSMASVEAMRDAVAVELGIVDVIVANAVIQYRWQPVLEQPVEDFDPVCGGNVMPAI
jgi:3-oxoacyl-[acyl-carrier protein] reductase